MEKVGFVLNTEKCYAKTEHFSQPQLRKLLDFPVLHKHNYTMKN